MSAAALSNLPVQKLSYSHEAMADMLISNPHLNQNDVAKAFGYTPGWVSRIINSNSFQEFLAKRKEKLLDPLIAQTLDEKFSAVCDRSLEVVMQKLEAAPKDDFALRALEITSRAKGYGLKDGKASVNLQQFIAVVPPKLADAQTWVDQHSPKALAAQAAALVKPVLIEGAPAHALEVPSPAPTDGSSSS